MSLLPLELEYLVVLQHARLVLSGAVFDLLHGQLDLPRLQVGDEYFRTVLEFGQFLGEKARAKVFGGHGEFPFAGAERGFDYEVAQVGDLVADLPQRIMRRGVPRKHQTCLAGIDLKTYRRHDMIGRQRSDLAPLELHRFAELHRLVADERLARRRDLREIRPDAPVEDVVADDLQRRFGRVHDQRLVAHTADGVDQERDRADMIQMRMCNEYVVDQHQLRKRHVAHPGSGIDQDVVVTQQGGGAQMAPADSTAAPEY